MRQRIFAGIVAILLGVLISSAALATVPGMNGKISFASNRDGNVEIYVMNDNGSGPIRLTSSVGSDTDPDWSPDGTRIAFRSDRDVNTDIYVMNADGSNPTRLTNNPASDLTPAWSPDGSRIAFTSFRDSNKRSTR